MKGQRTAMRTLIHRLTIWLQREGIAPEKIVECVKYITDTGK
jgi:hypothetical protein